MRAAALCLLLMYPAQGYAWDKLHQRLYDRGILHRKDAEVCDAEREQLHRMMTARTSTAARVVVRSDGFRWETIAVGILGGFVLGYVLDDVIR